MGKLIVIIILVVIVLALLNWSSISDFRTKNKRSFDFIISILTSFIGLYLALFITDYYTEQNNKDNVVKLLTATNLSIDNNIARTENFYLKNYKKGISLRELVTKSPMQTPDLISGITTNLDAIERMSKKGYEQFVDKLYEIETVVTKTGDDRSLSDAELEKSIQAYVQDLKSIKDINIQEINALK